MDETVDRYSVKPTDKQAAFILNTKKFSCMSGGFGSGKSYAGCLRALLLSQQPKNRGVIGRLTYPELRTTTRQTFFEVCPPEYYDEANGGQWKPSENYLRLMNGSEIYFMHMDTVSEKELLSLNLGWFYIDQAEEVGHRVWQMLQSRLRLNTVSQRYGFITCNPEPGSWIEDVFRKPVERGEETPDHFLMDSASYDNPYLPDDYVETLRKAYPEEMVKRYVEGRWDAFEGQIFTEFDDRIHVVKPYDTPKDWEYIIALDHGLVNPTACLLAAIDYDGNVWIIDEYYNPGVVSDHAKAILRMTEGYNISLWAIDPSTRAKTREKDGMPWSVIEEYEDYGLYFTPANNEVLASINRIKEFLRLSQNRIHPTFHTRPAPQLYIFNTCTNLITEMKRYRWKQMRGMAMRNDNEKPVDYMDHAIDALRYLIMSRFPAPFKRRPGQLMVPTMYQSNQNSILQDQMSGGDSMLGEFYNETSQPLSVNEPYE